MKIGEKWNAVLWRAVALSFGQWGFDLIDLI